MAKKNVIKEIIIVLLLALAIILTLGVLLYEYVPANKVLPEQISYVTPQSAKEELKNYDGVDEDKVILTYELDQTDLNNYQRIKDYKPGKTNPFSSYGTETQNNQNSNGNNNSNSGVNSSGTSTNNQTNQNNQNNQNEPGSSNNNQNNGTNKPNETSNQGSGTTSSNSTGYFQNKGLK